MKQRIVIKVQMTCDKCRKNALALAGSTYGVQSVGIEGEEQDQLVVVGDGVDATSLTSCLRKKVKVGRADIVKVEAVADEEAATKPAAETAASSTDPNPVAGWPPQWYHYHSGYYCPEGPGVVHPYNGHCYPVEDPCADKDPWCAIM
ncbi:heavy metal-associated isoprenylated plant protein 16-like [Miscanthus floridulus]|uniref:heavy metal-associated isoprenylated plant protein 16-like n=1 Tax=Miscanthus floridulus TaxID=154761 RepID=UPI00345A1B65